MTVLLTGHTGFLGNTIFEVLSKEFKISRLGRNNADYICDLSHAPPYLDRRYDWVIHSAGKAHVTPKTTKEEKEFYDVNFRGTQHLCNALEIHGIPSAFVFISTAAVYGVDDGEQITESHPLLGGSPYAESKVLAERWLQKWADLHHVRLSILRLPLIAGPNPPGNLGAMISGIRSGKYLSIGKADARKSIVWINDVANIIPTVATVGGVFNLTDGYHPTFRELENCISYALGRNEPLRISYRLAKYLATIGDKFGNSFPINSYKLNKITSTLTFDDGKARKLLNWQPTTVVEKLISI